MYNMECSLDLWGLGLMGSRLSRVYCISSSVSWSGDSMAILISWVSVLPSVREFHRRVLIGFIWEKLLSTEAVETGNVKPIEVIFCKFGNIVTSISFVISSLCCNAMLSLGFLARIVQKVIHSVCTSGDMTALFTVSLSWVRENLPLPYGWAKPQLTSFRKWDIGKNQYWKNYEYQVWPVLTQYHELKTSLKCFPKVGLQMVSPLTPGMCRSCLH